MIVHIVAKMLWCTQNDARLNNVLSSQKILQTIMGRWIVMCFGAPIFTVVNLTVTRQCNLLQFNTSAGVFYNWSGLMS